MTRSGRIAVAGFYDRVGAPLERRARGNPRMPFDDARYLASIGAPDEAGEAGWYACSSGSGCGRRWRSTACGAAIRGRERRR